MSMIRRLSLAIALVMAIVQGVALAPPAQAQSADIRVVPRAGVTLLKGVLRGDRDVAYRFDLAVGDRIELTLRARNPSAYMNVLAPGAAEAIHIGSVAGNSFATTATVAGPHRVLVYLMRSAARRGERSAFDLSVRIVRAQAQATPGPDFADGLSGGPDFWQVTGVPAGDRLSLRRAPSPRAALVARVPNGTVLRNRGCRMAGGQRWCQVEPVNGGPISWANGRFLREGAPPQSRPGDALVPGTNYHATGQVPCAVRGAPERKMCDFGVTRGERGAATVFITRPDGTKRVLDFDKGAVRSLQAARSVRVMRAGDSTLVDVDGGAEVYTVPDAVISGG
jgi:hypothetical protein